MSRKRLLVFRHGETDWNREWRMQGHTDIPLNATGREQAAALATRLARHRVEIYLSSDLSRALDTARAATRMSAAPLIIVPGLRETSLGQAEGLTGPEISDRLGADALPRWGSLDPADADFAFPGGESKRRHRERLTMTLESVLPRFPETTIGVSTHGGSLRRLYHWLHPELNDPVPIPNCCVIEFFYDTQTGLWERPRPLDD